MRVAAFRDQPHASAVASILQEQGYETEMVDLSGKEMNPRARDMAEFIREAYWARAVVISNCELDHFEYLTRENFGDVVFHRRCA